MKRHLYVKIQQTGWNADYFEDTTLNYQKEYPVEKCDHSDYKGQLKKENYFKALADYGVEQLCPLNNRNNLTLKNKNLMLSGKALAFQIHRCTEKNKHPSIEECATE